MLVTRSMVGCWGIDTSWPLSADALDRMVRTPLPIPPGPDGRPRFARVSFIARYVFFGHPLDTDISRDEAERIWQRGLGLHLVQHPRVPRCNVLSSVTGVSDAAHAFLQAVQAGYDPARIRPDAGPPWLSPDIEGVASPAPSSAQYLGAWAKVARAAGFRPAPYVGYQSKLTADDLDALGDDVAWWADFQPLSSHPIPRRGYSLHQYPQITWCGVPVDRNLALDEGFVAVVDDGSPPLPDITPQLLALEDI
jgi:hypothetical protein